MIIRNVNIRRFGKLSDEQIEFEDGLNIVYGPNESGKSTLRAFIINMLFGMKRSRGRSSKTDDHVRYEPADGAGGYSGSMEIEDDTGSFIIKRDFSIPLKKDTLINCELGEVLPAADADVFIMKGLSRDEYINTAAPLQGAEPDNGQIIKFLNGTEGDDLNESEEADVIRTALSKIYEEKKTAEKKHKEALEKRENKLARIRSLMEYEQEERNNISYEKEFSDIHAKKRAKPVLLILLPAAAAAFAAAGAVNEELRIVFFAAAAVLGAAAIAVAKIAGGRNDRAFEESVRLREQLANEERVRRDERLEKLRALYEEAADDENISRTAAELESAAIAYETMNKIAGEKKRKFNNILAQKVRIILRELLQEKDLRIIFDHEMNYVLLRGDVMIKDWRCSEGTKNLINQVIRLSAAELSGAAQSLPLILDDAFVNLDDVRCRNILKMLAGYGRQVILFTCQKREIEMLDEMGLPYERVRWSGNC